MQSGEKKRKDPHYLREPEAQAGAGVNMPFGIFSARLGSLDEPGRGILLAPIGDYQRKEVRAHNGSNCWC